MTKPENNSDLSGTPWEKNPGHLQKTSNEPKQKPVWLKRAAFSLIATVCGAFASFHSYQGVEGPGGMVDISILFFPVIVIFVGGLGTLILSIISLTENEKHSGLAWATLAISGIALLILASAIFPGAF
ncbi:hypothetical protein [Roseibacillus ishigakijimensis]|uniref:Uncharacterized protein n=1 Tax=Roseibacillus ishigakijimensis TaxID=454146 RepID=A0A934VL29_9BACT|nr:hypothetical protein [Roseibacillus ishigakijimensis]MBK1832445.1 hypothetical protein [Roseibacillus ishigakijimensis]